MTTYTNKGVKMILFDIPTGIKIQKNCISKNPEMNLICDNFL